MIMGCTDPSARPSSTEQQAIAKGVCIRGYIANSKAVISMALLTTTHSFKCAASSGMATRTQAAATAKPPKMAPITEALKARSWPSTGTTKVCTSQQLDSNQFTSSRRRIKGSRSKCQTWGLAIPCG